MINLSLVLVSIVFALQAVRCKRLVRAALWLAGVSAVLSILFYRLGAHQVAVIELSVGAGLVTVLMVFAIAIAGEDAMDRPPVVPRRLAVALVLLLLAAAGALVLPARAPAPPVVEAPFSTVLWEQRGLDTLVQIGLIFAGALGVLGLLSEKESAPLPRPAREDATEEVVSTGAGSVTAAAREGTTQ